MTHLWSQGEPVETWGADEAPEGFVWGETPHTILEVANRWRVHTRWWAPGQAIWCEYLKVATDTGFLFLIYRDLPDGNWYLARLYD